MLRPILAILFAVAIAVVVYVIGCSHTTYIDTEAVCDAVESRPGGICRPAELSPDPFVPDPEDFPPESEDLRYPDDPQDLRDRPASSPRREFIETVYPVELGEVRIVLAIDNSSSMSREHRSVGEQLRPFLNHIRNLKYRLAITTTDISSSPNNPARGQNYQDGNFIPIGGQKWAGKQTSGRISQFSHFGCFCSDW